VASRGTVALWVAVAVVVVIAALAIVAAVLGGLHERAQGLVGSAGPLVAALTTAVMAVLTWWLANRTAHMAEATRKTAEATAKAAEETARMASATVSLATETRRYVDETRRLGDLAQEQLQRLSKPDLFLMGPSGESEPQYRCTRPPSTAASRVEFKVANAGGHAVSGVKVRSYIIRGDAPVAAYAPLLDGCSPDELLSEGLKRTIWAQEGEVFCLSSGAAGAAAAKEIGLRATGDEAGGSFLEFLVLVTCRDGWGGNHAWLFRLRPVGRDVDPVPLTKDWNLRPDLEADRSWWPEAKPVPAGPDSH